MLHRGNLALPGLEVVGVRELTREDLPALLEERQKKPVIQRLREPHHALARALALGNKAHVAARLAGYSVNRVSIMLQDPTFQELVSYYRDLLNANFKEQADEYTEIATSNMLKAERMLADKLDAAIEADDELATKDLLAISRDAADRFGYGKKQTNLNVNVDFAAKLENTIRRSGLKVINDSSTGKPSLPGSSPTGAQVSPPPPDAMPGRSEQPPLQRRI